MARREEPPHLTPRPPTEWLDELARRHPDVDPSASLPIIQLLRVARQVTGTMASGLETLGLTEARFTVVMMIHRLTWETGAATPSQLAQQARIGRAAMTQLLDSLARDGWIKRDSQAHDRRSIAVTLTRRGLRRLEAYLPEHYGRLAGLLAELSPSDCRQLTHLLDRIEAALES